MSVMRKIIVYIATSADGYIARLDGSVDWLDRPDAVDDHGMAGFYKTIDTILWGRKTYDIAVRGGPGFDTKVKNYVFSSGRPASPDPRVEFVNEPIGEFAERIRATAGKNIWMMGGAGIIASFLDQGQIDEFIIHVIPIFIGEGIPLIAPAHRSVPLALRSSRHYRDGVVRLHYAVLPQEASKRTHKKVGRAHS